MPEEPITFEFIRKIQKEEQRESRLSKIPEDFYQKAKTYLDQKRKLSEKQKDRKVSLELKNIERLLEDIFNRRETKMFDHAIITVRTDIPPQNLIEEEKEFFESSVNMLRTQRQRVLNTLLKKTKEIEEFKRVKFLQNMDEFIGVDLKKYGPFKKGEKVKLPTENVNVLIERRMVKVLK